MQKTTSLMKMEDHHLGLVQHSNQLFIIFTLLIASASLLLGWWTVPCVEWFRDPFILVEYRLIIFIHVKVGFIFSNVAQNVVCNLNIVI